MRARLLVPFMVIAVSTLVAKPSVAAVDLTARFADRSGCLVVYDRHAQRDRLRFNPERCRERVVACSTFKVPLAVMAFDAKVIDRNSHFHWDGKHYPFASWEQDQTPATWLHESVVWASQLLTPQLGRQRLQHDLAAYGFGSADISGGLTTAWLTTAKGSTLTVSADEQIQFWDRLCGGTLPASKAAQQTVCELVQLETTSGGAVFSGKTGSGNVLDAGGKPTGRDIGWFVGRVQKGDQDCLIAANFTDQKPGITHGPGGFVARALCREVLGDLGLL